MYPFQQKYREDLVKVGRAVKLSFVLTYATRFLACWTHLCISEKINLFLPMIDPQASCTDMKLIKKLKAKIELFLDKGSVSLIQCYSFANLSCCTVQNIRLSKHSERLSSLFSRYCKAVKAFREAK